MVAPECPRVVQGVLPGCQKGALGYSNAPQGKVRDAPWSPGCPRVAWGAPQCPRERAPGYSEAPHMPHGAPGLASH